MSDPNEYPPAAQAYVPPPPPVPVAPLAYDVPAVGGGRPGILTAVGVVSIVVAGLSFLASLYTGLSLLMFKTMATFAPMMVPPTPVPPGPVPMTQPAQVSAAKAVVVAERGLDSADRSAVARGLGELRFLSSARVEQLDALLAEAGKDIFAGAQNPMSPQRTTQMILSHTSGLSANPGVAGPDTFRTENGRFELYDDRAVFYPNRGDIVRVSTLTTSTAGLNADQVEQVVAAAQTASGNTMNPAQLGGLRNLLSSPTQQHVSVVTLPTAIRGVQPLGDGSVSVSFPNGFAQIGPQGQVQIASATDANGVTTTTGAGGTFSFGGAAGPAGAAGRVRVNGAAMALAGFAELANGMLAAFLLVSAILVLRNSPRGRKLHLFYAWIKIPLTLLGAMAVWWLTNDLFEQLLAQSGGTSVPANPALSMSIGIQQGVLAVLGLIYPVALLIVMQTRTVKDYYNSVRMD